MNHGKRLQPGDTIGVVAPSSFAAPKKTAAAVSRLTAMGYQVKLGRSCNSQWYSFAGEDRLRADDINTFFQDPAVDALLCLRGGYGAIRLPDLLDYNTIRHNPKIFVGYSDITLLHLVLNQCAELITFHGPMVSSNFTDLEAETKASWEQ
jgi:muramoyltetrapeptide carboxypeptidase